jgi:hypothetical protein
MIKLSESAKDIITEIDPNPSQITLPIIQAFEPKMYEITQATCVELNTLFDNLRDKIKSNTYYEVLQDINNLSNQLSPSTGMRILSFVANLKVLVAIVPITYLAITDSKSTPLMQDEHYITKLTTNLVKHSFIASLPYLTGGFFGSLVTTSIYSYYSTTEQENEDFELLYNKIDSFYDWIGVY